MKVTGSAFADFARDEYTTLPERKDRPLYIHMDIGWRYDDAPTGAGPDHARYVAGEQVADLGGAVFHRFVSLSIQHLVNEIGAAMLERWPQLAEVSFESQNRLWDLGARRARRTSASRSMRSAAAVRPDRPGRSEVIARPA